MKVYLPREFSRSTMYEFIGQVLDDDGQPRANEFDFDFTRLGFIEPVGVTVLSNLIGRLWKYKIPVKFTYVQPRRDKKFCPIAFLDDSMFFRQYLNKTLDNQASLRSTTRPLENVTYERSYEYLDSTMFWLAGILNITKISLGNIKSCLQEIFNNIKDHSHENNGYIFIQHYPSRKRVTVSVSDFGIGIPRSIQALRPTLTDSEALRLAITQGFSTKSTPRNRGAGLDTLLHNVVIGNGGNVYIHSNHGILYSTPDCYDGMEIISMSTDGFYPGTLIEIEFRTDTIEFEEEEFSWE